MAPLVKNMDFFVAPRYHSPMEKEPLNYHNTELVAAAAPLRLNIRAVACGTFTGHWASLFPFNRLVYIFETGPEPSRIRAGDAVLEMRPGRWLLLPAGLRAEHEQNAGLRLVSVHFSLERLPGLDYLAGCPAPHEGDAPERRKDFAALLDRGAGLAAGFHLQALVWSMIEPVVRRDEWAIVREAERLARFGPLFEAVAREPRRDFTVDEMARTMGLGKVTFIKRFTAEMGRPPKEFLNRMRAAAAARELLATDDPVREIADRFDFSDEFYFSRFMKRMTGLSPRAYRRALKGR